MSGKGEAAMAAPKYAALQCEHDHTVATHPYPHSPTGPRRTPGVPRAKHRPSQTTADEVALQAAKTAEIIHSIGIHRAA